MHKSTRIVFFTWLRCTQVSTASFGLLHLRKAVTACSHMPTLTNIWAISCKRYQNSITFQRSILSVFSSLLCCQNQIITFQGSFCWSLAACFVVKTKQLFGIVNTNFFTVAHAFISCTTAFKLWVWVVYDLLFLYWTAVNSSWVALGRLEECWQEILIASCSWF